MATKERPRSKRSGQYYSFDYKGIRVDPYRILLQYGITHPAHQHAIKKLLRAGRSIKSLEKDIDEVIDALTRWKEMNAEDAPKKRAPKQRGKQKSKARI